MKAPESNRWADFEWPEWVPANVREQIEAFWLEAWGRGPRAWMENAAAPYNEAPEFGARVRVWTLFGTLAVGRYVHAWNNIGRLVLDDGSVECVSTRVADDESIARYRARLEERVAKLNREVDQARAALVDFEAEVNATAVAP